ncbi:hypothetical protein [Peribacillus sp. YIM B13482]|uniref:hypothetical protein n=1 Tax=Peribacillus sp. YIM B13482 TaxID=3366298 RepID=UPI00366E025A
MISKWGHPKKAVAAEGGINRRKQVFVDDLFRVGALAFTLSAGVGMEASILALAKLLSKEVHKHGV